jgi:hypothetical protein
MAVLDDMHARAVLEHRARLGKPLTDHAAQMLARSLAAFADPNAAADRMTVCAHSTAEGVGADMLLLDSSNV